MSNIDEVDDDLFISKRPQNYIFADKKANDIVERTSKSLQNTRALLHESEAYGQSTLEELSNQREALERTENNLDSINDTFRATQKHLKHMRSFFGGIKSLFSSGINSAASQASQTIVTGKPMPRSATLADVPSNRSVSNINPPPSYASNRTALQPSNSSSKPEEFVDEFDANLGEIGHGLGRLKEMAMKLGDELVDQDQILDRITEKSERAGDTMKHQDRQVQQLLKKG